MKRNFKRLFSLVLALCAIVSFALPAAAEEQDAVQNYVFPEYGEPTMVAKEALLGELTITQFAVMLNKDGKDYILAPDRGGSMYVFKLTEFLNGDDNDGTWIYAKITTDVRIPTATVVDSKGTVYVGGDSSTIFGYNIYTGETVKFDLNGTSCQNMAVDEEDNLYVATTTAPTTTVVKIDTKTGRVSPFFSSEDFVLITSVEYAENNLYLQGLKRGAAQGMRIQKLSMDGKVVGECLTEKGSGAYYLDYVDGVLFVGHSGTIHEGCVAIDTATMQKIDIGVNDYILGLVTDPKDGKSYMNIAGTGIYEYDLATRKATRVPGLTSINVNLRIRNPYLDVSSGELTGKCIITLASGGAQPILMSLEGKGFIYLDDLVKEAVSPATTRSIGPGVKGLMIKNEKADQIMNAVPEAEVAVYVGGYLCGSVASYAPGLDEKSRLDSNVFSNGVAQTDTLIEHNGKIYGGGYGGAHLFEFDPATGEFKDLFSLYDEYKQMRIHSIVGSGDRLFFSTVPTAQLLGGYIGWYDISTEEITLVPTPVKDQIILGIAYDEEEQLLYCSTSIDGGTQTVPTQTEAVIMVYDVAANKKLGEFSVRAGVNPNSDMVFDLEGNDTIPPYIAGVAKDPTTGKIWGLVSRTLFSMKYDRATNTLKVHEEWCRKNGIEKTGYPASGSLGWFPRPFCFDGKGNLYINLELDSGFYRINTADPSDVENICTTSSRAYCLGSDGNLYFVDGDDLYTIALDRVSIVKSMIDGTAPNNWPKILETKKAYAALTEEEKAQTGEEYAKKLTSLEGAGRIFLQVAADKVIKAIDEIGAVTVTTAGPILNARRAYDVLEADAKTLVTNYELLTAAEIAFASIRAKTQWSAPTKTVLSFSTLTDSRLAGVPLQSVTYGHTNDRVWEYAFATGNERSMKFNAGSHLRLSLGDTDFLALRVQVKSAGVYDLSCGVLDWDRVPDLDGCLGGIYMFPINQGASDNDLYAEILAETSLSKPGTPNYIGSVNFHKAGDSGVFGSWECPAAGEYLLVISKLENIDGSYAYIESFTLTKSDPTTDTLVEMTKERINAIGKVSKKSGDAIKEARMTFDALSASQKELIYAEHIIKAAEEEYAYILANDTTEADNAAVALVQIQIAAIGEVSAGSGEAIKAAREAYDALSKKLQKQVNNYKDLTEAEAAYLLLTAEPVGKEDGGNMTTVIIIVVVVAVLAAAAVAFFVLRKKKKAANASASIDEILNS